MSLTIREKAATVATFRFVQEHCMGLLARWVPTTPETQAKLLMGRHIWTLAQHADALGRRTYELRKPLQCCFRPSDAYMQALATLAVAPTTAERLYAFYRVLLPDLSARYRHYLAQTDALLDAPTVRVFEDFLAHAEAMRQEAQQRWEAFPQLALDRPTPWIEALRQHFGTVQDIVVPGASPVQRGNLTSVTIDPSDTMHLCGMTFRRDPAREACFTVVHLPTDMHEYADMSLVSRRERLHRHMNNEIGSLEIAALCLVDFPEAPWELRMQLARQCWDEMRHVELLHRRLQELGGYQGEFPIANLEWTITCMLDSLPARLAVQNRTFEAGQMDLLGQLVPRWRSVGDEATATMLEGILADEIQHVRFANQWIKRIAQDDPRTILRIAMAMRFLTQATTALAARPGTVNAVGTVLLDPKEHMPLVNVEARQHADFTPEEIHEILRQSGFRSLAPQPEMEVAAL